MTDPITEAVKRDLDARTARGLAKYGVALGDNDASERERLQHLYEELLDAAQYAKWRIMQIDRRGEGGNDGG